MQKKLIGIIVLTLLSTGLFAQSGIETDYWFTAGVSKKLNKRVKLFIEPELRFSNTFELNELIIEAGSDFKIHKYITVAAAYRYADEYKSLGTYHYNQFGVDAKPSFKPLKMVEVAARIRYSNFSDYGILYDNSFAFRYKIGADYEIKPIKITFSVDAEWFQTPDFSEFKKVRYSFGTGVDVHKNITLTLAYKYEHFLLKDKNEGILNVGVKVKL